MIFRPPLFLTPGSFFFLLAWHSVLDLHARSPDKEKERDTAFWSAEQFSLFRIQPPAVVALSLFNHYL